MQNRKYSVGGTLLSGMIGAYVGYKYAKTNKSKNRGRKLFTDGGEVGMYDAHKANIKYLNSISEMEKMKILKNIANHYGINMDEAEEEVTYDYAEYLYEYIANDPALRMEIYRAMKSSKFAGGGGVSYNKVWEVIGINLYGKMFKERITLGRMSDKEDVKNALRRRTDLNIREVTSIKEVFAKGGMTEHGLKIGDEIMGYTKDVNELHVVNRKNNDEWHSVDLDDGKRYEGGGGVDDIEEGDIVKVKSEGGLKAEVIRIVNDFANVEFVNRRPNGGDKTGRYKLNDLKLINEQYAQGGGVSGLNDLIRG